MKLAVKATKDLSKQMERRSRILSNAVRFGVKESGFALLNSLRKQMRLAGLQRLQKTWRKKDYKNNGYDAASLVYSKVPEIVTAFDKGLLIRTRNKQWLAIPTKNAPRPLGRKQKRTPERLFNDYKLDFRFVERDSKTAFLVAKNARGKDVIMFTLIKQAKIPKRLDIERSVRKWTARIPDMIERELEKQEAKQKAKP
ncbi:MAG: hypothetical protein H6861_08310 [Rhodospirillales bacterium]|nr:hypothetical protein [Rhodospirillales bacterium]